MENIDITGLDKAEVLLALIKNSKPTQMFGANSGLNNMAGLFSGKVSQRYNLEKVRAIIKDRQDRGNRLYFDYLDGLILIKMDITGDTINPGSYNRDCGEGAAERAIAELRERLEKNG